MHEGLRTWFALQVHYWALDTHVTNSLIDFNWLISFIILSVFPHQSPSQS